MYLMMIVLILLHNLSAADDDLYDVLEEVIDLQGKWTDILAGLRLPPSLPSTIKAEHSTNTRSCLQAVLLVWLTRRYNVEKHGLPSWRTLVKAVADRIGGADISLALDIAKKHPGTMYMLYCIYTPIFSRRKFFCCFR